MHTRCCLSLQLCVGRQQPHSAHAAQQFSLGHKDKVFSSTETSLEKKDQHAHLVLAAATGGPVIHKSYMRSTCILVQFDMTPARIQKTVLCQCAGMHHANLYPSSSRLQRMHILWIAETMLAVWCGVHVVVYLLWWIITIPQHVALSQLSRDNPYAAALMVGL